METYNSILDQLWQFIKSVFAFNPDSPLLFTQFHFWAFFAIVFVFFALLKNKRLLRNSYLFFISLLFYYKTSGLFVGMLLFITISDFFIAQGIYILRDGKRWKKKALLTLSLFIDLGVLCYFKYSYFFADFINSIFGTDIIVTNIAAETANSIVGSNYFCADKIILPVGISFYTFQIISYVMDVYREKVAPVRNILDFGFYVSFFPQLVAGPIVKATDFIPQLYRKYNLSRMQFGMAVFWIVNGLIKKIILSDYLAVNFIDRIFDNPQFFTGFETLAALFFYSLQVYADFSGYTDIAIGLSQLMGFHLPQNFNSPYKAPNCSNFWKRWHISLSRWLQNYLYIPLGGNRNVTFGTYFWIIFLTASALLLSGNWWIALIVAFIAIAVVYTAVKYKKKRKKIYANLNSMITMLLGGLWHGASLNFIIWGGLNGLGMIVFKFWRDWTTLTRALVCSALTIVFDVLAVLTPYPVWNLLCVSMIFLSICMWIKFAYKITNIKHDFSWLEHGWSILVTFVFITFTRLFFRSGSNLDPATANETAWNTAKEMVNAIGTRWNVNVWEVVSAYSGVFLLFCAGMIIHWLPLRIKRRYRIAFAKMPLPMMCLCVILCVFIIYQFITAEMQPFIYFQF